MTLSKENLIRLSCYLRQAERTLDRALHASWQQVRGYYAGALEEDLRSFLDQFPQDAAIASESQIAALRSRHESRSALTRLFTWAETRLSALRQPCFTFDEAKTRFFLSTLRRLLELVAAEKRPDQADLVRLRLDAGLSVHWIRSRYGSYLDFDRIMKVDHFLQPEFTRRYSVDEILAAR